MIKYYLPKSKLTQRSNSIQLDYEIQKNPNEFNLTKRELEVLNKVIWGYTAKEIGKCLNISFRTVEAYINTLKIKLGCNYKRELTSIAIKAGLLSKINLLDD